MTDLQIAKNNLAGHTICLCRGGNCLYSSFRGIEPMLDFIGDGVDLAGYSAADIVVGKAVALLFVKCRIKEVFAKTLSEGGKRVLDDNGIFCEYEVLTKNIINRMGTDICPMEKAVANTENPQMAYSILKEEFLKCNQ